MNCRKTNIASLLQGSKHFVVPCYQRPYSWTQEQCRILFDDLLRLSKSRQQDPKATHFLGSLVLQEHKVKQCLVIDGQQRLITTYLLYLALAHAKQEKVSRKLPFTLLDEDHLTLEQLYEEPTQASSDSLLTQNYHFFCEQLKQVTELAPIEQALPGLELVAIKLEAGDDPQLIFESLNAKGLTLSIWDKIRNFALLDVPLEHAALYYRRYWGAIENLVPPEQRREFIYYYLEVKRGQESNEPELYYDFKQWFQTTNWIKQALLKDLLQYAELFVAVERCELTRPSANARTAEQAEIEHRLKCLQMTRFREWMPFVLSCLQRYRVGQLPAKQLLHCLQLTETFIFRRWLRLASRKSLETFFVSLFKTAAQQGGKLDETVGKLMADPSTGMATDEQVRSSFETMSFNYSNVRQVAMRNFVLARLEEGAAQNQGADPVPLIDLMWRDPNRFSCEHIMPQKLSPAWRKDLGAEADKFHALWQHRIANLTLTSHNAEYSNKSFKEKCRTTEHGLAQSSLFLNRAIARYQHWSENELTKRTKELTALALKLWPLPNASK